MVLLDNDAFLTDLSKLLEKSKTKGSVFITMKRYIEKPKKEKKAKTGESATPAPKVTKTEVSTENVEPRCLIRCTDGNNAKFSTLVLAKDVVKFQMAYGNILKAQMDSLKRKEKKKKSKKVNV